RTPLALLPPLGSPAQPTPSCGHTTDRKASARSPYGIAHSVPVRARSPASPEEGAGTLARRLFLSGQQSAPTHGTARQRNRLQGVFRANQSRLASAAHASDRLPRHWHHARA